MDRETTIDEDVDLVATTIARQWTTMFMDDYGPELVMLERMPIFIEHLTDECREIVETGMGKGDVRTVAECLRLPLVSAFHGMNWARTLVLLRANEFDPKEGIGPEHLARLLGVAPAETTEGVTSNWVSVMTEIEKQCDLIHVSAPYGESLDRLRKATRDRMDAAIGNAQEAVLADIREREI